MSILDFAGFAGLLLAIAAALDFMVKEPLKRRLATQLMTATTSRVSGFRGAALADRFFGARLLSLRAISRYSALSIVSLALTYGFAYLTTPNTEAGDIVSIFQASTTLSSVLLFCLAMLSAIFADILSYSQTRIFLGAVDRYKSAVVSLGLIIADGLISVGLFSICFSFVRFVGASVVFNEAPAADITTTVYYQPAAIARFIDNAPPLTGFGNYNQLIRSLTDKNRRERSRNIAANLRSIDVAHSGSDRYVRRVRFSVSDMCPTKDNSDAFLQSVIDSAELLDFALLERGYSQRYATKAAKSFAISLMESLQDLQSKPCSNSIVEIKRMVSRRDVLYIAGAANAFLAALERTAFDTYSVAAFKFAPYVSYDPYGDQSAYINSLNVLSRSTFLGLYNADQARVNVVSKIPSQSPQTAPPRMLIPFSPMLASCLTITVFFSLYLAYIILISLRNRGAVIVKRLAPSIDLDKALFTSVSLTLIAAWAIALLALKSAEAGWSTMVG